MFDAARGASFEDEADACVFAVGVAAPQGFSGGGCFAFEVGLSFVRPPPSGRREVECDSLLRLRGIPWGEGECTLDGVLSCGPIQR